jgi:sortase (surface protein transpeptidase)
MEVPPGHSNDVGWYKNGTIPGNVGSAVIDAHVYAAFEKLRYVKVGSEVIVENANGERLKFVVNDSRVYKLGELTSGMLFGRRDARRLNLITCAGQPTADGNTYTHRLVVYTTLA